MNFQDTYKRAAYLDFFRDTLLPEDFYITNEPIDFQTDITKKVVKIGEVPSLDLPVFEIKHKSENDPRVTLSKEAFRILANYGKQQALILFISTKAANFRLSLVTLDLKLEGKKPKTAFSNPRRYSFFLGPEAKLHTIQEYLSKPGRVKDFEDLKSRFSIEVVNKEFYDSIATLFTFLTGGKRGTGKKAIDTGKGLLELPQTTDDTIKKNFAVRLIGRLIFCWFLKKKKSKSKDGIALLPEQLLSAEAIKPNKGIGVFYHSVLEPLFFEVLNTPIDERNNEFKKEPWSIIPFLNGGLFAPHEDDFYKLTFNGISEHLNTLIIPDDWLKELFKVFETYNFTIDENTSIDVELSIEPEMLGRIFENLLAEINPETGETARKATGSYYTPRPIVEYMVDESIKQYLATKTGIADDKFVTLLSYSDEDAYLTEIEKDNILNALDTIKIIDPACGSGAFPMGILQKILLILQKIDPDSKKWLKRILAKIDNTLARKEFEKELKSETINYIHKLGIIQNSIFGVDIQPIAVEISKLRFFLSLIVDENVNDKEKNRGVKPLPNLEFKFVCANTLIDLPKAEVAESKKSQSKYGPKEYKGQNLMLEATDEISELKKLRDEYLNSYGKEKILIEEKFRKVQSKMFDHSLNWQGKETQTLKLSQWDPFSHKSNPWFDPEWMFGINDGFDIVIANPPYIKEAVNRSAFDGLRNSGCYQGKMDLWYLFGSKGLDILRNNGVMCFIATNNWVSNDGASKFRNKVLKQGKIVNFIDFRGYKVFAAGIQTMVFLILKNSEEKEYESNYAELLNEKADNTLLSDFLNESSEISNRDYTKFNIHFRRKDFNDKYIKFVPRKIDKVLKKMKSSDVLYLADDEIFSGIDVMQDFVNKNHLTKLGNKFSVGDGIFVLSNDEKNRIPWNAAETKIIKPYYTTKEINRYIANNSNRLWIVYTRPTINDKIAEYPQIKKHLYKFQQVITSVNKPYGLHRTRDEQIFLSEKLLSIRKCSRPSFSFVDFPCYVSRAFLTIKTKRVNLKYLLALLNSKIVAFWLLYKGKLQGNLFQVDKVPLVNIPIKDISVSEQTSFIDVVDKILNVTKGCDYLENPTEQAKVKELEKQIDQMVYKLYDLTKEEIAIVEEGQKK